MSIIKHAHSNTLHYRFNHRGKVYTGSTGTTDQGEANKFELERRKEIIGNDPDHEPTSITLQQALHNHIETMKGQKEQDYHRRYAGKLLGKKQNKNGQQIGCFGLNPDTVLHTLKDKDIAQLINARRKEGNAANTIRYELVVLSQAIKKAHIMGYMTPQVDISQVKKVSNVKVAKGKLRFLSQQEEKKLLEEAKKHETDTHDFILLLLDTGCRYQEIAQLEWDAVDLKNKQLRIYRGKVDNESTLYLTDRALEVLLKRKENNKDGVYVFTDASGKTYRKYNAKNFKTILSACGINGVTFHTLRHTFASRLVQAGISITDCQAVLGHKTPNMTMRYAHLSPSASSNRAKDVLNKLNGEIK